MTRLVRVAVDGHPRVGVLDDQAAAELALLDPARFPTIASALAEPDTGRLLAAAQPAPDRSVTRLPPIDPDARVFCVAQNYGDHARETSGTDAPPAPIIFMKPTSALVGPDDDILLLPVTSFLDHEAELAILIGGAGGGAPSVDRAGELVRAATCLNDGSARDLQPAELGGKPVIDWFSGKSLDASGAVGPWLRLIDDVDVLADVQVSCRVNEELVQNDRTSSMVHDLPRLVEFVSSRVRLRPGDVIATGTPGGVGAARGVPLADGDVVEVEVEEVGRLTNTVRAVSAAPVPSR